MGEEQEGEKGTHMINHLMCTRHVTVFHLIIIRL